MAQGVDPPPHESIPEEPIRDEPIRRTTVPVCSLVVSICYHQKSIARMFGRELNSIKAKTHQ